MTPPKELTDSGLYVEAAAEFDAAVDAITAAVAPLASQAVRGQLDEFKRTIHKLLKAHRLQVIDDVTAVVSKHGPALSSELREIEQRLRNLELLMRQGDEGAWDDYDGGVGRP
jgi:hypothetical protein